MLNTGIKGPFFTLPELARRLAPLLACLLLVGGIYWHAGAQTPRNRTAANTEKITKVGGDDSSPLMAFMGVSIGTSADEVRKKLGEPKDKADDQDFFIFNEKQTAQVLYDKSHKVITISADFVGGTDAPTPKSIFGEDIALKPDGSMYKLVRYPKAGYWVSYNRTAGDTPLVTVTIQKN